MSRFIPRHIIGRMVDEVSRIYELRAALSRQMDDPPGVPSGTIGVPFLFSALGRGASTAPLPDHPFDALGEEFEEPPEVPQVQASPSVQSLSEVADGRLFNFNVPLPARRVTGQPVRLRTARLPSVQAVPQALAFDASKDEVITCLRRKARRRAILASGNGGGSHARPRRRPDSNIRCE